MGVPGHGAANAVRAALTPQLKLTTAPFAVREGSAFRSSGVVHEREEASGGDGDVSANVVAGARALITS